jgi:hypothetical protein
LLEIAKFGKIASYHSRLARCWGVVLAIAVVSALAFRGGTLLLDAAMLVGIACNLEGIAMSLVLPVWTRDVPSFRRACLLRHQPTPASSSARLLRTH